MRKRTNGKAESWEYGKVGKRKSERRRVGKRKDGNVEKWKMR